MRDLISAKNSHAEGANASFEREPALGDLIREHKQMLLEMEQARMREHTSFNRTIAQFERGLAHSSVRRKGKP